MEDLIDGVNAKYCGKCKELKLFSEFSKNKHNKQYGLQHKCKVCTKQYHTDNHEKILARKAEYRKENKEVIAEKEAAWRLANPEKCKAWASRYYEANKERLNAISAEYYENNKEHCLAWQAEYRKAHAEEYRAYLKQYRLDNAEVLSVKARDRYIENREETLKRMAQYYSENTEAIKARVLLWAKNNPDKCRAYGAKRRAAELQRTPSWLSQEDHVRIAEVYAMAIQLSEITGVKHQVDHIIPLQGKLVSGLHVPENLQILTASENASKKNKFDIEEFNNGNA